MPPDRIPLLLADLALILLLARLLGAAARRVGQPAVVGEIVAGVLAGPTLGHGAVTSVFFPADIRGLLGAVANLGLALFMFEVGTEFEPGLLKGAGRVAASVSMASMALPFGLGVVLALEVLPAGPGPHHLESALFLGTAMSVTAFPVLARILADRGMLPSPLGSLALQCAAVADVIAWILLAALVGVVSPGDHRRWLVALVVPYALVCVFAARPVLTRLRDRRRASAEPAAVTDDGMFALELAGLLLSGAFTEWIGLHFVFGAFLFGAIIPRAEAGRATPAIPEGVSTITRTFLLPVYFLLAGLQVDLSTVDIAGAADLCLIIGVAVAGKLGGAYTAARLHRIDRRRSIALAALMNTRGLTELVILTVGLQFGLLRPSLYSLMVVMAVITTMMTGPLLDRTSRPGIRQAPQSLDDYALVRDEAA